MTTTAQDLFITGLKNAHAMENQALSIMSRRRRVSKTTPKSKQG